METTGVLREEIARHEDDVQYKGKLFNISAEMFNELGRKSQWLLPLYLTANWLLIFLIVRLYFHFHNVYLYPLFLFLIAGRQGALLNLAHEMVHNTWAAGQRAADFVGKWFCCSAIGMDYDGYKAVHMMHHQYTNMELDPPSDREKYKVVALNDPRLWGLFLKDIFGITALQIFLAYASPKTSEGPGVKGGSLAWKFLVKMFQLAVPNLAILLIVFKGSILDYALLWLLSAVSVHMLLMRIRGIGEHGLGRQLHVANLETKKGQGLLYTRSTLLHKGGLLGLLEKMTIGSVGVNYHHEHHLFPSVPFQHLPKLHKIVRDTVVRYNPYVYSTSYLKSVFFPPHKDIVVTE